MKEIDFEGIDIDEALKKASEELKITADNLEFEIISLGSKGLFGLIGNKPAVIRVSVKPHKKAFVKEHKALEAEIREKPSRKGRKTKATRKRKPKKEIKQEQTKEPKKIIKEEKKAQPEDIKKIEDFVLFIVRRLDEDAKLSANISKNKLTITIKSEKSGKIIGKSGRIIGSVEYLATKYANKIMDEKIRTSIRIEGHKKNK